MQEDIISFSKKLDAAMGNIGNYIDNNMLIIESIEYVYVEKAVLLKEYITKYSSNLSKVSLKFQKFKGNKSFLGEYFESISNQIKIAKKAYQIINKYIINDGIENKIYHQFYNKLFKAALSDIFTFLFDIEKRDSVIAKSLVYKTSKFTSTSIPNDLYNKCLSMVVCGSCEYVEKIAMNKLAQLANEIMAAVYRNINDRYEKMMEEILEFRQKGLEQALKLDFKEEDELYVMLSTMSQNSWNPRQVITNQMFIKNTEYKDSFSASLREGVSSITTTVLENGMPDSIKNERFELSKISNYFKNFQNDLKNEIIKKGYIYAYELISLKSISDPISIPEISKKEERQSSSSKNKKNTEIKSKKSLQPINSIKTDNKHKPTEKSMSTLERSLPIFPSALEDKYIIPDSNNPNANEKLRSGHSRELSGGSEGIQNLSEIEKRMLMVNSNNMNPRAKNNKSVIDKGEMYDSVSTANKTEDLYENEVVDQRSKNLSMNNNYSSLKKSDFSNNLQNKTAIEETDRNLNDGGMMEDETNTKLPYNLVIGKTYKILTKYFNANSEVDESYFIEGDPCKLVGIVEKTNFCMINLLRLDKEVCVPIDYIVDKTSVETTNHKGLTAIGKIPSRNEDKEKLAQKSIKELPDDTYE